jgi:hypothetical protein
MKKLFLLITLHILTVKMSLGQNFDVDTLLYNGETEKYINIVVVGDGYTSSQQSKFITDASNLSSHLFSQVPFKNYKNYFNVFAVKVISTESGAKHPNTSTDCSATTPAVPVSNPNTYLGCSFDSYGIHRLVVPQNVSNLTNVLATNFPNYDQVLVIANSQYYGGSGGIYSTSTVDVLANEITAHEIGHSFSNLGDEYYAGDVYAYERPNLTQQTNPLLVKWKNFIGFNGTGIYQHCCGGNSALWYRPHNNCKMRSLGPPFCSVCTQTIIESIHGLVNPLVNYSPIETNITSGNQFLNFKLTEVMKPISNTLKIKWNLNSSPCIQNVDSIKLDQNTLPNGLNYVSAVLTDTTNLLRVDNHSSVHFSTVTWTINKLNTDVKLSSSSNKISYSIFPNPSSDFLNIELGLDKKSEMSIRLFSIEGKLMEQIENNFSAGNDYSKIVNLKKLPAGIYSLIVEIDKVPYKQNIVKQ